ncbi:MAG: methylenetetrahydrofolate reductase C-terminal domain-containing protein [Candidatus Ozemobacteraceae bacterium]
MIKTVAIPVEDLFVHIPEKIPMGIIGCGECAAALGTGGTRQVDMWVDRLKTRNPVVFSTVARSPCDQRILERFIRLIPDFDQAKLILLLACPAGVQSLGDLLRRENRNVLLVPALKVEGLGWLAAGRRWSEACVFCQTCTFEMASAAHSGGGAVSCPTAACPLHKADGPCQNRLDEDRCPIAPETSCIWLPSAGPLQRGQA